MDIDDFGSHSSKVFPAISGADLACPKLKSRNFHSSLKQWRMLQAVVDHNGFLGASNYLHISQSTISYSISKLENQLGIPLLKITGRKACITETGKILLERSRNIIQEAIELETLAESLRTGSTPEIRLAMDLSCPSDLLIKRLRKFTQLTSNVVVTMHEAAMPEIEQSFQRGVVDIAVVPYIPVGMVGELLIQIEYVAVAHPSHPLFLLNRLLTSEDLAHHIQVTVNKTSSQIRERNTSISSTLSQRVWNVCSLDTAIHTIVEGISYGWLPKYRLPPLLREDQLRLLPLAADASYTATLYLLRRKSSSLDEEIKALATALLESN